MTNDNPLLQLLQRIEAHQPALWESEIILKRKEFLKYPDRVDTNIYFIESGSLRMFIEDNFEEQVIRLGYEGSMIAAIDSFISERPSPYAIQAIKKCRLKKMSKKTFMHFIQSDSTLEKLWLQLMELSVLQLMEREIDVLTSSPIERYQRVLKRSPHLFQLIPHKHIASYLRMSPETLSRIKNSNK